MKKTVYIICMCVCALGLLSGCGGEFAEEMEAGRDASGALTGAAVSGQAVSGQAVSGQAVRADEKEIFDSPYCSDHGYYMLSFEEGGVTQISLETGDEKRFKIEGIYELVCVQKDALYCTKERNDRSLSLWRIPIEAQDDGSEELKTDQAEPVKGLDDIYYQNDDIYIDDEYIVYREPKGKEDAKVICYDRGSGQKTRLPVSAEVQEYLNECEEISSIRRYGDRLDFMIDEIGVVGWELGTGEMFVCSDNYHECYSISTEAAAFLAFDDKERYKDGAAQGRLEILRIDMATKEKTEFVSEQEILSVLETEAGIQAEQLDSIEVWKLYCDGGRLYIDLSVSCAVGDTDYVRSIFLYREDTPEGSLKYEKAFSEFLWEQGEKDNDVYEDENGEKRKEISSYAECYELSQGMACVLLDPAEENIVYDLKAGTTRPGSWKEKFAFG